MKLVINIAALDKTQAAVNSITDPTPVAELQQLTLGASEPLDITFTDSSLAPPAAPSWAGATGYTLVVGLGSNDADGLLNYTSTTSFTPQTAGWTGRLNLATQLLIDALKLQCGFSVDRARFGGGFNGTVGPIQARPRWAYFYLQIVVIDPSGNSVPYAVLRVPVLNRVLPANVIDNSSSTTDLLAYLFANFKLNAASITALQGGSATCLDGYDDTALPTGCTIELTYSNISQTWKLEASTATTDITATPARVRAKTFAGNNRVWFQTG